MFAFSYAACLFPSYQSLHPRTPSVLEEVSLLTVIAGACLCITMGLSGYLLFRNYTDSNILNDFSGRYIYSPGNVFKILLAIQIIVYIPNDYVVMRLSLYR